MPFGHRHAPPKPSWPVRFLQGKKRKESQDPVDQGEGEKPPAPASSFTFAQQKYISYYGVTLTNDDIRSLRYDWLTDNNISFWEEYLERVVLPQYQQARICLLRPSMSLLLMNVTTDIARSQLPNFRNITHIFLPISDVKDLTQAEGGSHWSLLVVSTIDGVAFHFDSLGGANISEGQEVTARLSMVLGMNLRFRNIEDTPQQDNGNDCGVFVCKLMHFLLVERLLKAHAREKVSMRLADMQFDPNAYRQHMYNIINRFRQREERPHITHPFVAPRSDYD